jgi:hypothetical protein
LRNLIATVLASPFWSFLSVVVIAWITQGLIAWRERKHAIRQKQLEIYLSTLTSLSKFYTLALQKALDEKKFWDLQRQYIHVMGTLSIMGTADVMVEFETFSDHVFSQFATKEDVDEKQLTKLFSNVTYAMCCDVHGEKFKKKLVNGYLRRRLSCRLPTAIAA